MLIIRLRLSLLATLLCAFDILIFQPGESRPMENIGEDSFNFGNSSEESSTIHTLANSYYDDSPTLDFMGSIPSTGTGPHTIAGYEEPENEKSKMTKQIAQERLITLRETIQQAESPEKAEKIQEEINRISYYITALEFTEIMTSLKKKAFKEEARAMLRSRKKTLY
ncbi:hypothetical protein BY996DRAFT_6904140 [Phakopsora pachyrhizi]|uniref:Expressed protein n=1 Tax=Phakopsora pachyrhizi TaxID=170000 RepID=A0AAV0BEC1_PHAPC|nr:hypothetical protein BY996DRAFT_6904140 [Phakopsora pachyrhizi]CAH7685519.1 expressed protein [Phakopsora pachyrhizi]